MLIDIQGVLLQTDLIYKIGLVNTGEKGWACFDIHFLNGQSHTIYFREECDLTAEEIPVAARALNVLRDEITSYINSVNKGSAIKHFGLADRRPNSGQ